MTKLLLVTFFLLSLGTLSLSAATVPAPEPAHATGAVGLVAGMPP